MPAGNSGGHYSANTGAASSNGVKKAMAGLRVWAKCVWQWQLSTEDDNDDSGASCPTTIAAAVFIWLLSHLLTNTTTIYVSNYLSSAQCQVWSKSIEQQGG